MTFANAPWAVDGALTSSSLARLASYASLGGAEGIISKGDLKVSPLNVAGNGIQIADGGAILLNRYQTNGIDQAYVISNVGVRTLDATEMPGANASAQSYLVMATVGDPEFSQVGHPWMTASDPAAGTEQTFQYVRPWIYGPVPAGSDEDYPANNGFTFPGIVLARLDIPANTTTIDASMITDLRRLARPRQKIYVEHASVAGGKNLTGYGGDYTQWQRFPDTNVITLKVPDWAVTAKIQGYVEGLRLSAAGQGVLRVAIQENQTGSEWTQINESNPPTNMDRRSYNVGGEIPIPAELRGTNVNFVVQGKPTTNADSGFLATDSLTSVQLTVTLEEQPE